MAQKKLTFTKVVIMSLTRKPESGRVFVSCAPPSKALAKAMKWGEDMPEWLKQSTPETSKLTATLAEFVPTHADLGKHAFDLQATQVSGFEFVRVQVTKGKTAKKAPSFRLELHCAIDFRDPQGAGKIEKYFSVVTESQLKITYEEPPEQEELLTTEEQRQAVLEAND